MTENTNAGTKAPQYYIVWMSEVQPLPPPAKSRDEIRQEHHDFLHGLEQRGVLLAAGPFRDTQGKRYGCGMMILRADNHAEADAIAAEEPYVRYGLRKNELTPWQLREGSACRVVVDA